MVPYPLTIHPRPYRGKNQSKLIAYQVKLEQARKIADYLNDQMKDRPRDQFNYYSIADAVGLTKETVKELLQPIEYGSHGITMYNPSLLDKDGNPIQRKPEQPS